ncbi:MAG: hypothetical protein WCK20_09935 [Thermoleophilia bacterium]
MRMRRDGLRVVSLERGWPSPVRLVVDGLLADVAAQPELLAPLAELISKHAPRAAAQLGICHVC